MTRENEPGGARTRLSLLGLVLAFLLVACGGGDDEAETQVSTDTTQGDDAAPESESEPTSGDDAAEPAADSPTGESMAIVTIGDQTYEADLSGSLTVCISMGGAIGAAGPVPGIEGSNISIDIPPEDYETSADGWEPPSIRVDLGEDANGIPIDWRAGGDVVAGLPDLDGKSQVDSFTIDGTRATGTATFIDLFQVQLAQGGTVDEPQPVPGTFEVACG